MTSWVENVRQRAYKLWQVRGCGHGYDQEDWYIANILLQLEEKLHKPLDPPEFRRAQPREILGQVQVSHKGIYEFFSPKNSWIETTTDLETIFEFDRNRKLHFDEGFLTAARRIASDASITAISNAHHFPYRDLVAMRQEVQRLASLYRAGTSFPPPLFFYPAAYQLEILDGVHRCLAAFETLSDHKEPCFKIWVGFQHNKFCAGQVVQQLWSSFLRRLHRRIDSPHPMPGRTDGIG